jgi:hypothetical protein
MLHYTKVLAQVTTLCTSTVTQTHFIISKFNTNYLIFLALAGENQLEQ